MKLFKNILYVLGSEGGADCGLARVAALARNNQARLTLFSALPPLPAGLLLPGAMVTAEGLHTARQEALSRRLENLAAPWRGGVDIDVRIAGGSLFLEAVRDVLAEGRDLLVKCAGDDGGLLGRLFGSDDLHLLRKCPCPVWLQKPGGAVQYRRVLAAVDVDDLYPPAELTTREALNLRILELATSLALSEFAELHLVHCWNPVGESAMRGAFLSVPDEQIEAYVNAVQLRHAEALERLLRAVTGRLSEAALDYLKPVRHLPRGWPRDQIPALAERIEADVVVLGTVGRTGVPGLLMGNTAEVLLHRLDCSVLALKPEGFESPVRV